MKCVICGQPAIDSCDYPQRTGAVADVLPTCKKPLCRRHFIVRAQGTRQHKGQSFNYIVGYCPDHHSQMKQREEAIPQPLHNDE